MEGSLCGDSDGIEACLIVAGRCTEQPSQIPGGTAAFGEPRRLTEAHQTLTKQNGLQMTYARILIVTKYLVVQSCMKPVLQEEP